MASEFELNIAILGNTKAGKKTLLDTLLRHGGCSYEAGEPCDVRCYTVFPGQEGADKENCSSAFSAEETGQEEVRLDDGVTTKEIKFNVGTVEPIVPMRPGTSFKFVIVPPVDQVGCEAYISKKWGSFDTVIVVLDGAKGLSDDDSKLLKHIKKQNDDELKQIIVLCNKIDDTESERLSKHVKKASSKVKKIFGEEGELDEASSGICFLPMSAVQAYVYRAGSRMTVDEFKNFDKDLFSIVGKDHFGSKNWKKFTDEEKCQKTHATISNTEDFESGIADCGFKDFMTRFYFCLGGPGKQKELIQKKIDKELGQIAPLQNDWISYSLFSVYGKQSRLLHGPENEEELGEQSKKIIKVFWETFEQYNESTFNKFVQAFPHKVKVVVDPIQELIFYQKLVVIAGWDEHDTIKAKVIAIVKKYLVFLIKKEKETNGNSKIDATSGISPIDWSLIWRSVLLLRHEREFLSNFSQQIIILEELAHEAMLWKITGLEDQTDKCPRCLDLLEKTKREPSCLRCKPCGVMYPEAEFTEAVACSYCGNEEVSPDHPKCPNCKYTHENLPDYKKWLEFGYSEDGKVVPTYPEKYAKVVHIDVPESLNDPDHFAHPIYKLCEFMTNEGKRKEEEDKAKKDKEEAATTTPEV